MQQLQAVLDADPANTRALLALASVHRRSGQAEAAMSCYERLKDAGAEGEEYRLDLAALLRDRGNLPRAEQEVELYLAAHPENQRARVLLADVLSKRGNARQAAQTLHEVLAYTPDDQEARRSLAAIYRHLGEPRKAIETLEGLINQLEKSAEPKDVAALAAALEEYEQVVAEHEKDYREEREHTMRRLREMSTDTSRRARASYDEDAMMLEELEQVDEDEVPIIDIGGKEPVFAVPEESEDLKLGETDEEAPDVPIDDERPPDLVNLLHDQELYEENPAWKPFQPFSPGQAEPSKPSPPAAPPHPFSFAAGPPPGPFIPAQPAPPYPPSAYAPPSAPYAGDARQGPAEAGMPASLRQAFDAQQRMVDRLSDELRDLSRRIETRPPEMPAPTGMPAAPAGPEAAPETATAGTEPGDWLPDDMPKGKPSVAAAAPPVPELELPEPEDLESLEEVHELPAEELDEPAKDLRQQMRDYINGVRERLEARPAEPQPTGPLVLPENGHQTGALLDYLAKLSEYLPEREKTRFHRSDVQLSMERIRSRLSGGRGLTTTIDERYHPPVATGPLTRPLLFDAFSYLRGLAGSHPDPAVGAALAERIEGVIVRIGRAG